MPRASAASRCTPDVQERRAGLAILVARTSERDRDIARHLRRTGRQHDDAVRKVNCFLDTWVRNSTVLPSVSQHWTKPPQDTHCRPDRGSGLNPPPPLLLRCRGGLRGHGDVPFHCVRRMSTDNARPRVRCTQKQAHRRVLLQPWISHGTSAVERLPAYVVRRRREAAEHCV